MIPPLAWFPSLLLLLGIAYVIIERLCRFPRRTISEVREFIREVNIGNVLPHLEPALADVLRGTFSKSQYRLAQHRQLHFIREYLERMSHNSLILIQLANTEIWRETEAMPGMEDAAQYLELARSVLHAAIAFRFYVLCTLARIRIWMIFRTHAWSPFPAPHIPDLRQFCGVTLYGSYNRLRAAVAALCMAYGQDLHDEIMSKI